MQFNLKATLASGVRSAEDSKVHKIDIKELIKHINADRIDLVKTQYGLKAQLRNSKTAVYYTIGFGATVGDPADIKDLDAIIKEAVVFTSNTDRNGNILEKPWFSFGLETGLSAPVGTISVANLFKPVQQAANSMAS